jgi:hypothetical protein
MHVERGYSRCRTDGGGVERGGEDDNEGKKLSVTDVKGQFQFFIQSLAF